MIKVCVDMSRLKYSPYVGFYNFSMGLGHGLAALEQQIAELSFYTPQSHIGIFGNNVNYIKHISAHKYFLPGTSKFDVFHITTQISKFRPYNRKTKVLLTLHDLNVLIEQKHETKLLKQSIQFIKSRIDLADHIACISDYVRKDMLEYFSVDSSKVSVIHNGFHIGHKGFIQQHQQPSNPFIFTIGTLLPKKNFHVLPALLVGNDYDLIIAGENKWGYDQQIMEIANLHGVAHRIKFAGAVAEAEKIWYYQHCAAFVFPSVAEGFGLPVLEAMSFGKPVFLSTHTCLPEIGGNAAYYFTNFEPEHMQQVFENGMNAYNQNTSMQNLIKERASLFSWERAAKEYIDCYQSLITK